MKTVADKFMNWLNSRLQRKFIFILVSILLVTSVAFGLMVVGFYKNRLVAEHTRASLQVNRLLQVSLENAMLKRDIPGLREIVDRLGEQKGISSVMIVNPTMQIRFSSDPSRLGKQINRKEVSDALKTRKQQTRFFTNSRDIELLRSVNPVHNKPPCKECHGDAKYNPVNGLLVVDYDAASIKSESLKSALILAGFGFLVLFITGLGIWVALNRLVLSRLLTLRHSSLQLASGNLDARAHLDGIDEISGLGKSFDQMAGRLSRTLDGLNAAEHFLQKVIDSIPDGVRVIDADFNIIKANRAYCRQISMQMDKVIGTKCFASSHGRKEPCPVTLISCPVVELAKSGSSTLKCRHQHIQADGGELFVEISAARVNLEINGKQTPCIIESIRDLAEQAKISQEQRLSEIGQLATGVAHEIHNPLSSIQLALQTIQQELEASDNCQASLEYFEIAEAEIAKCLKVTDGLMMLSEPPDNESMLVDISQLVKDVISLLSYQASQVRVSVEIDLDDNLRVLASDSDMRMIVVNLTQNAFHAMPNGGVLKITGRRKAANIELSFIDNGIGIPKSNLDKIFLPFWTKRADSNDGRGLGLSICKAIIDRFNGSISVTSKVGEGTCFTCLLPTADI